MALYKAHVLNSADDLAGQAGRGRHRAADAVHGCGDHAAADGKDRGHQLHASANRHFCQHKADEMPQSKLRPLQFPEGCRRRKNTDGKEQHQQAIADAHKSGVDIEDHAPDLPAL